MTDGGSGHVRSTRRSEEALSGPAPDGPSLVNHDGAGADLTRIPRWTDGPGPGGKRADPAPGILVGNLVHPAVESAIDAARGGGHPLEQTTRQRLEHGLGASLGEVRVHDDDRARGLADAVSARAFTVGHDLFFAAGAYRPGSPDGDHLLAHEAIHALQQGSMVGTGSPQGVGSR